MVPNEMKLLNMLSNNDVTFFVPPYQRNYEWTTEQCEAFFDDVEKTYEKNSQGHRTEHFFGSITYFQTERPFGQTNELVLIDGQQRITTTMLFLCAVRDISDDDSLKKFINDKYLKNANARDEDNEYKIKLKQVETDWSVYVHLILQNALTDKEKTTIIYKNYRYFISRLTQFEQNGKDAARLIDLGLNKFSVISIELEPDRNEWENPQEVFESMNSLGKPLSLADLVRNYLLLGLNGKTQETLYKKYWLHIEQTLPGQVSNYIRDFMQWHYKTSYKKATEANYKELYRIFKEIFSGLGAETVMKKLSNCASLYASLLPDGKTGHPSIDYELKDIQFLRVTTAYSFLLALLDAWKGEAFSDDDIVSILHVFKIYIIRRRILGLTQAENKAFPLYVNYLDQLENAPDKGKAMLDILAHQENRLRLPNDIELGRYLETANFYNLQSCRFILSLIEEKLTKNRPGDEKIQIEHIMPQTLNQAWKDELGPDYETVHQEYVNTIGNLTLIRHNQELGNKSFSLKKEVYENNAGLQIARTDITNRKKWNKASITNRARWIIGYLLTEVIPIPEEMRRTNNFKIKATRGLSFLELQLIGETISFCPDSSITAKVVSDKEVEFEGRRWLLSPLTRELFRRMGMLNKSGAYKGSQYWSFDGIKLSSII
jgi:uncharacterized protein with ParB-like and HNH nuclease domain